MALALSTPFAPSSSAPTTSRCAFPLRGVHFAAAAAGRSGLPLACAAPRSRGRRRRGGTLVVWAAADYYATLGVQRSADIKAIKAAYRKLARQVLDACPPPTILLVSLVYLSPFYWIK
jgi:molecular chaperone DnaJ